MKILILDIETSPNLAYVWGLYKQNISLEQVEQRSEIICWAAKWLHHDSIYSSGRIEEAESLYVLRKYLDEADVVVTHNGKKFDLPVILSRMLVHGYSPPSPFHQVDTYQVARSEFRFVSNKLENLAIELRCPHKSKHKEFPGFMLWLECLKGNKKAWVEMLEYNIQDVKTLEQVYLKMRPYIRNHPHVGVDPSEVSCPKCGSHNIQYRGYYRSSTGLFYKRFRCTSCGGWGRVSTSNKELNLKGRNAR